MLYARMHNRQSQDVCCVLKVLSQYRPNIKTLKLILIKYLIHLLAMDFYYYQNVYILNVINKLI